jgi:hypothetical protein
MPRNSDQESEKPESGRQSRRNFLAKFGLGAVALAAVAVPVLRQGNDAATESTASADEFPGEDSIFHPAIDPRLDPRRKS